MDDNQKVKFLDVGHGDSSIIYLHDHQTNNEKVVIIDIADGTKLLWELQKENIKVIDLIIISHSDADHCRGLNNFMEKFMETGIIKSICYNLDRQTPTKTMIPFLKKFYELYHRQRITLLSGQLDTNEREKELISDCKTKLLLIYPNTAEVTNAYVHRNTNDASIVCLLKNEVCSVLFAGDLGRSGWIDLLNRMADIKCDVLKMPHHGAFFEAENGVGLEEILDILLPEVAIISSGENAKYRHPGQETIEILNKKNIKVYCTEFTSLCHGDMDVNDVKCYGDVEILINDNSYEIKSETSNRTFLEHAICNG